MRKFLDRLYDAGGVASAVFIALICLMVTLQVIFNTISKLGLFGLNLTIPSYADFSGYFLASASFLALAYTLKQGGHIRVKLVTRLLGRRARFLAEQLTLFAAAVVTWFACYHVWGHLEDAYVFGDRSSGIISIPIYIPMIAMLTGLVLLAVCLTDYFIRGTLDGKSALATDGANE